MITVEAAANRVIDSSRLVAVTGEGNDDTSYVAELRAIVGHRPLLLPAAAVIVVDASGAVLLQRRAEDGTWGIPGGCLELGESLEDAARRELREETGLVAEKLRMLDVYSGEEFFIRYPND